jgi:hypothetical protein
MLNPRWTLAISGLEQHILATLVVDLRRRRGS